jgi:flagellar protein FliO/FliZ
MLLNPQTGGAAETPASAMTAGSLTQMLVGLVLVLGVIVVCAWALKRMAPRHMGAGNNLRIVAGAAVGQRERVVVLEIGATWLVVGVAPGSVRALHQMPRVEAPADASATAADSRTFSSWLQQLIEKRRDR